MRRVVRDVAEERPLPVGLDETDRLVGQRGTGEPFALGAVMIKRRNARTIDAEVERIINLIEEWQP